MMTIADALALAIEHHQAGRLQAAEQIYRQILRVDPGHAQVIHFLGVIAHQMGDHEQAVEWITRAIALNGTVAAFHNNLGQAYRALRRSTEAIASYQRALDLKPDSPDVHYNLGCAFAEQGSLDDAIASYNRALQLKPGDDEVHNNLGNAFADYGRFDEAIASYLRALELKPDCADTHNNLGTALWEQGNLDDAVRSFRRALTLEPKHAAAYNNMGNALKEQGRPEEAIDCYRRAVDLRPDYHQAHSNLLFAMQYCPKSTPAALLDAHVEFDRQHAAPLAQGILLQSNAGHHPGRLRLGFVSPDLGRHPVGYFFIRVLEGLQRAQRQTICYSDRITEDDMTHRFRGAATYWRSAVGISDEQLARQIRADQVDILFDLTGHSACNRMLVFARKPAPIQITWIGYEGTTGLAAMDYLLADRHMVDAASEPWYCEKVLRMPDGYLCYDPPASAPPVAPLPASRKGHVTFGSFSNLAKITPQVVSVWAHILRRLPSARLMLKYRGLRDPATQRRYRDLFEAQGVEAHQLDLLPWTSYAEYLETYQQVDAVLDPFSFCGCATTCEAMWMGVPVVTCPMETFASRHSLSILSNVGVTETIARDLEHYVELAIGVAGHLARLAALRASLRDRMASSPLCDGQRFVDHFLALLRQIA